MHADVLNKLDEMRNPPSKSDTIIKAMFDPTASPQPTFSVAEVNAKIGDDHVKIGQAMASMAGYASPAIERVGEKGSGMYRLTQHGVRRALGETSEKGYKVEKKAEPTKNHVKIIEQHFTVVKDLADGALLIKDNKSGKFLRAVEVTRTLTDPKTGETWEY